MQPMYFASSLSVRWRHALLLSSILVAGAVECHAAPGDKRWEFATGGPIRSSPAVGTNGLVYFGSFDAKVYALDGATGTEKWRVTMPGPVLGSPALGADGVVYIGSRDGRMLALDGGSGVPIWTNQLPETLSSPALGANGLLYVATRAKGLHALDSTTGQVVWKANLTNWINVYASPSVGADETVFCASGGPEFSGAEPRFFALDGRTGLVRWKFASPNLIQSTPAIGGDATVYIPSYDKLVYALDPGTGAKRWEHLTADSLSSSPALGPDGTLYVGANDGRLYALDAATGDERWTFLTGDTIHSTPAVAADGTVYFGSYDKRVYAVNAKTGAEKWRFKTGDLVLSSPVLSPDGTVLIGSNDGKLYALEGSAPLAQSPWPEFKGGPLRSGSAGQAGPPAAARIAGLVVGPSDLRLTLLTVRGRTHHLEASESLRNLEWVELGTLAGNGGEQWFVDRRPAGSMRFYRLRVE